MRELPQQFVELFVEGKHGGAFHDEACRQDAVGEIKRVVPIELEGVAHGGFVFAGDVIEERDHGVGHVGSVEAVNCSAKYVDALGYELR